MSRIKSVLTSLIVVGFSSVTGMFVGSYLMYWFGMGVYIVLLESGAVLRASGSGPEAMSGECSRWDGVVSLSLLVGALLGIGVGCERAINFLKSAGGEKYESGA